MLTYFPGIHPYEQHSLRVDSTHELYIEECGNPNGIPVLFVHGGPGGGCSEKDRCFFDPNHYRIILFDQRGSGRSTPHCELKDNNTQALVEDMEKIRNLLKIKKWVLFGGSWGSTLSLVYAQTHPSNVLGMILRGIFLGRTVDHSWLFEGTGANNIFPDHWEKFINIIPEDQRNNLIKAYFNKLTGKDEVGRMSAAKTWSGWEAACSTLNPNPHVTEDMTSPHKALALAKLECYYFMNQCFLEDDQILNNANKLRDIPGIIVHGRYDIVCSLDNAWQLHAAWPASELHIVRDAGHASCEPGIVDALIRATKRFETEFSLG